MNVQGMWIGWRFYRARQQNGFIGFISMASTIGIALGVMVLIIVLSAMNGFERELVQRYLGVIPHAEVIGGQQPLQDWQTTISTAENYPEVQGAAPYIKLEGLIQKANGFQGIQISAIDIAQESKVSVVEQFMSAQAWQSLGQAENNLVLGQALLNKLGLKVGDRIAVYLPQTNHAPDQQYSQGLGKARSYPFVISGSYQIGGEVETMQAYMSLAYADQLLNYQGQVTGVRLALHDVFQAPQVVRRLGYEQQQYVFMDDWTRSQGHLYNDIQLVRFIMYLALTIVIAVACFNIVSTLVMAVRDKASEIAILMSMGMSRLSIMSIFMVQGALNGLLGCLIGGVLGVLIALNLSDIGQSIEALFGVELLDSSIYFIDFLPSQLQSGDVLLTLSLGLSMSLIATLYPAYRATKVQPALALAGRS